MPSEPTPPALEPDTVLRCAFGNLAFELLLEGVSGKLVAIRDGRYVPQPLDVIRGSKKLVNVDRAYDVQRLRPRYVSLEQKPLFVIT